MNNKKLLNNGILVIGSIAVGVYLTNRNHRGTPEEFLNETQSKLIGTIAILSVASYFYLELKKTNA
jgi:hypothetical protein